ncbi:cytochrome b [Marinobacter nanhaiticus D15-8W]|uniref:Cytochrome b n=1 Tax=Marinobacter nanhaiticus D15-8W TaxID=626887 RepID=N6VZH4_9GAMM|nr:cytochrome b [Marinobacter nanhaiticus]ENO13284.1 cytochrome b [Marinobacter nanhaiticus D15-8W]BES70649.1 cytochrome b [Marinobacter nanhaiticus D15-8W]
MARAFLNDNGAFGWTSIVLHWLVAVAVFGLFGLGLYMVELTYYDEWYRLAPHIHKSIGILLLATMVVRVIWRIVSPPPKTLPTHKSWEKASAHAAHALLYVLIFVAMISGYLITTTDGSSIDVFNWFSVPSVTGRQQGMEELAGKVHYWSTWAVVVLAGIHALGALKHHLMDRDETLRRMLGLRPRHSRTR